MRQGNLNSRERLSFFDAVISWASEINKELDPSASSREVIEAYNYLSATNNSFFKTKDGSWNRSIKDDETMLLMGKIVWLRTRVIM